MGAFVFLATAFDNPRLLPKRDEFARPALHCVIICGLRCGEVSHQSYQLLDVSIPVIPKLDSEWQIVFSIAHLRSREQKQNTVKLSARS